MTECGQAVKDGVSGSWRCHQCAFLETVSLDKGDRKP